MGEAAGVKHHTQRAFLAAFAATGDIGLAAAAVKVDRKTHNDWKRGKVYRNAWENVEEEVAQRLENEAIRRAYEGVKRPVLYKGKPVKTGRGRSARILYEPEYSDQLLITLLKRFRPNLYRERVQTEVSGSIDIVERLQAGRQRLLEMRAKEETG